MKMIEIIEICSNESNWRNASIGSGNGDKPLSEPMLTLFTDAYMRYQGKMH